MAASIWDGVDIGGLRLANRAVMPAMGTGYCSIEGMVTERLLAYFKKRAAMPVCPVRVDRRRERSRPRARMSRTVDLM